MSFRLGNHNIDEIIYMYLEDFDGNPLGVMDQMSSAEISITSESTDITDKNGNIVRTIYRTKQGEFTATNAFMHPQLTNLSSGAAIQYATKENKIVMPKLVTVAAGGSAVLKDVVEGTIRVIGTYGSGANTQALTLGDAADFEAMTVAYVPGTKTITVPAAGEDAPQAYVIKYDRTVDTGMKLTNDAKTFPSTCRAYLYCSYVDPCDDDLRAMILELPSLQFSPETTISLDAETQEMDVNATIQVAYCEATPTLYNIYYPDENAVKSAIVA